MKSVPRSALYLGLAGLLPFYWGMATMWFPGLYEWAQLTLSGRFVGPYLQLAYGTVILAFMSGVLWGFAAKSDPDAAGFGYALSVIPALWAFFMVGGGPVSAAINLMAGFLGLLLLDWQFWRLGLAPAWWMHLRVTLTIGVMIPLLPVVL